MITTVKDIAESLRMRALDYAKFLLPNGKEVGGEWEVGSIDGEEGKSLKVRISGDKAGVWADFSSNDKGDLIGLTMAVRKVAIGEAIRIAKEWLGVRDPESAVPRKTYSKPKKLGVKSVSDGGEVLNYLVEKRNLDIFVQADFKIAESVGKNGPEICFPYIGPDGQLVNIKRIAVARSENGKKFVMQEPGCAPSLFGWQALKPDAREVIITEGEIDAMTWHSLGFPALSIPDGAEGSTWIDYEWENLQQFDRIWLNWDNDAAGQKAVKEFARRLGFARCFILIIPGFKDANEALVANQPPELFMAAITASKPVMPEQIKTPNEFADRVIDKFYPPDSIAPGFFSSLLSGKLGMRPGEVTLWTGISGHGKALAIDTDIFTALGWKKMANVQVGDVVFDEKGNPCNVLAATETMYGRPCYEVTFSDGTQVVCDEQHEWFVSTCRSRQSVSNSKAKDRYRDRKLKKRGTDQRWKRTYKEVKTTRQINETLYGINAWDGKVNNAVDLCDGINLPTTQLPIEPYCLGVWLGDGANHGAKITSADPIILQSFKDEGWCVTKRKQNYDYGINGGFLNVLRANNLICNKHIPDVYMVSSFHQRLSLLQGLMDTDGHITDYGRCEFCNMNERLAKQVFELVCSLGMQASHITGRATLYGKDCGTKHRITFTPHIPVFRLQRKAKFVQEQVSSRIRHRFIVSCKPVSSVPVKCIEVDSTNRLYLCTRSFIPTHNSAILLQLMLEAILLKQKVAIGSFEMLAEQTLHRMLCQSDASNLVQRDKIKPMLDWLGGKLWIYDLLGNVRPKLILELLEYSFVRHGVNIFVIDSLMKCSVGSEDYDAQRIFLNDLCSFAKDTRTHINLVAHARKGRDEAETPGKLDVKGSSDIINQADNILTVWRNKEKESAEFSGNQKPDQPDTVVYCNKQRENGTEFKQDLTFMKFSYSFRRKQDKERPNLSIWEAMNPIILDPPIQQPTKTQESFV